MTEAFDVAAVRHWSDAEFLNHDSRLSNADQLYGFAAECALKVVLLKIPGCRASGLLQPQYMKHVDQLWELVPVQSIEKIAAGMVALLRSPMKPFADWSVDQRYESGEAIGADILKKHHDFARRVLGAAQLLGERRGP